MRSSNKSRSRNKSSNRRSNNSHGNVVNRVFDSSGPDGRVRGTPQQIIEKYASLAHDATLSDDIVAAESFRQHAEHYSRMLVAAQRVAAEQQAAHAERQAEQQAQHEARQQQQKQQNAERIKNTVSDDQPDVSGGFERISEGSEQPTGNLVATPENKQESKRPRRRKPAPKPENVVETPAAE